MLRLKKSASTLLLICLTVSGCNGFPERPKGNLYQLNTVEGKAYEYEIPKTIDGGYKYTGKDMYIIDLDNYFCISPSYQAEVKAWMKAVEKYAEDKCK